MSYSTVLIVPTALRDRANLLGAALGYGPTSYTVPIPPDAPPSHWGAHTYAGAEFFAVVAAAQGGALPPIDWSAHGLSAQDVIDVLTALHISAPGSPLDPDGTPHATPAEHFAAAVAEFVGGQP